MNHNFNDTRLRVLDLFSGIGGFSLGLERAGFETVAFCENDPWCRRVLAKHWPKVPIYDDIRQLDAARLRADGIDRIDLVCGGFPCQDVSLNGQGAGLAGERSGLWRDFSRLNGELRPSYAFVENVGALLGRGLAAVLADLASFGYDAEWHAVPAAVIGAPPLRDRTWIVATRVDMRPCAFCGYVFDHDKLGRYGCPNCLGEGLAADTSSRRVEGHGADWLQVALAPTLAALLGRDGSTPDWPQWSTGSPLRGVDDGVPSRLDKPRLKALGNAVVPALVEVIGAAILQRHYAARRQAAMAGVSA